jgi:predicted Fe-Mo cluster-binding NifX family protein
VTVIAINVDGDRVGGGWGRAHTVALATVADGAIQDWAEEEVRWDELHDEGTHGSHHARIARFLKDHAVEVIVTGHMGPPMVNMITKMNILGLVGGDGEAKQIAADIARELAAWEGTAPGGATA